MSTALLTSVEQELLHSLGNGFYFSWIYLSPNHKILLIFPTNITSGAMGMVLDSCPVETKVLWHFA